MSKPGRNGQNAGDILPVVPSAFLACHHFPDLSTISRISPFVKDISFGSSGFAVSVYRATD